MVATTTARKFCPDTGDVKMNEVFLELRLSLEVGRDGYGIPSFSHEFELALCVEQTEAPDMRARFSLARRPLQLFQS